MDLVLEGAPHMSLTEFNELQRKSQPNRKDKVQQSD